MLNGENIAEICAVTEAENMSFFNAEKVKNVHKIIAFYLKGELSLSTVGVSAASRRDRNNLEMLCQFRQNVAVKIVHIVAVAGEKHKRLGFKIAVNTVFDFHSVRVRKAVFFKLRHLVLEYLLIYAFCRRDRQSKRHKHYKSHNCADYSFDFVIQFDSSSLFFKDYITLN